MPLLRLIYPNSRSICMLPAHNTRKIWLTVNTKNKTFLKNKAYLNQKHKVVIAAKVYGTSKYQPRYGRRKFAKTVVTVTHKRKSYGRRDYNTYGK